MIHSSLCRYLPIIEAPEQFLSSLQTPLNATVWLNPLKTTPSNVESAFSNLGWEWSHVPWYPGGYRLDTEKPGRSLPFNCGWYGVQEEIAWSAVRVLAPEPGDRILDLCAAPGGKTAQLALAVGPSGSVMANERALPRLSSLIHTITRLGLTNVITSQADGRTFRATPHSFDRVLVDAPCSGEGTLRKKVKRRSLDQENWHAERSQRLTRIQQQLLDQALTLVKPGGVVVYSTCTFAPEENEAVIDAVVGDRGIVEPYPVPGLQSSPGVCQWQGQTFRPDSQYAQRYWPHLNNTGGFFVARIRRTAKHLSSNQTQTPLASPSNLKKTLRVVEDRAGLEWLCDRFGIPPTVFNPYKTWQTGYEKLWIANHACTALATSIFEPLETIGLPLIRRTSHSFKPTTVGLQRFGNCIQSQTINLDEGPCYEFMEGHSIQPLPAGSPTCPSRSPTPSDMPHHQPKGFVHVRHGFYQLGCGRAKNNVLYPDIPKALRLNPHKR